MADQKVDVGELILRGGVLNSLNVNDIFDALEQVKEKIKLPASVSPVVLYEGLCAREHIMSTAVGHGIAIPHCHETMNLLKSAGEQQVTVVYLKNPIDMNAPDGRKVDTLFVLLTSNSQSHLQVLSQLAGLFKNNSFLELIRKRAPAEELAEAAQKLK